MAAVDSKLITKIACHICEKPFDQNNIIMKDHDYFTGKMGALHIIAVISTTVRDLLY